MYPTSRPPEIHCVMTNMWMTSSPGSFCAWRSIEHNWRSNKKGLQWHPHPPANHILYSFRTQNNVPPPPSKIKGYSPCIPIPGLKKSPWQMWEPMYPTLREHMHPPFCKVKSSIFKYSKQQSPQNTTTPTKTIMMMIMQINIFLSNVVKLNLSIFIYVSQ